jgi:hypothetical protein
MTALFIGGPCSSATRALSMAVGGRKVNIFLEVLGPPDQKTYMACDKSAYADLSFFKVSAWLVMHSRHL